MIGVIVLSKKSLSVDKRKLGMESITPQHYLILAFLLFSVGFFGVVLRRNLLLVLMSLEQC